MIQKIKNQNKKYKAFTLIEMLIVLVIMWIMLMVTLFLSGDQIQKVRDKTVKESILAEMQSRYSKNLWSSSFSGTIYDHMDVTFSWWDNKIIFSYYTWDLDPFSTNSFIDKFEIKLIASNYKFEQPSNLSEIHAVNLQYNPYKISCEIKWEYNEDDKYENVVVITRVNDSRDYCFEIKKQNCRLIEMSESKCCSLEEDAGLDNNCNL